MESEWIKSIITVMTIISTIGAAVSGYYAYIAGRLSKGSIAYQFFVRYSDDKMRLALMKMGKFKKEYEDKHRNDFIDVWFAALVNKEDWALELEESRHVIKYFYRDVATLYQSDCIKYSTAKRICSAGGVFLFTDCILPMEKRTNPYPYENEFVPIPKIASEMLKLRERYKHSK